MTTAMVSAAASRQVRRDLAMTGEVTLRGRVLPIGGVKDKLLAAHRAGLKTFILPAKNVRDLHEIDQLRTAFNTASREPRLIVLVSPT